MLVASIQHGQGANGFQVTRYLAKSVISTDTTAVIVGDDPWEALSIAKDDFKKDSKCISGHSDYWIKLTVRDTQDSNKVIEEVINYI